MSWYLGIAATALAAGVGWRAAHFLRDVLESFILPDDDE